MARGKHAVKSANRRSEAKDEIIDRLTDDLAEAKARARMVEREAAAAERLRAENAELRRQLDEQTAPAVQDATAALEAKRSEELERLWAIAYVIRMWVDDLAKVLDAPRPAALPFPHVAKLGHIMGTGAADIIAGDISREDRRALHRSIGAWADAQRRAVPNKSYRLVAYRQSEAEVNALLKSLPAGPLDTSEPDLSTLGTSSEPTPEP